MDKIRELITILNNNLEEKVILAFQGTTPPPLPYISLQILDYSQSARKRSMKKLENAMAEIENTTLVNVVIQFNCLGKDLLGSKESALNLHDFFSFKHREELWDKNFGVVKIGNILERTVLLENTKYEYISNMDVTLEFERSEKLEIENLQSIKMDNTTIHRRN
ncbi:MAG: phage neck terminator protein [Fusobacteriaceae bacterium]